MFIFIYNVVLPLLVLNLEKIKKYLNLMMRTKLHVTHITVLLVGLQVPAGHHCYPGYGRAVGRGQAQGGESQEDRAIPLPALPGT
jgi:hypothetical protein